MIPPNDEILGAFQKGLGESLAGLVLYGSVARGEAHEGSDIDLLVVAKGLNGSFLERQQAILASLPQRWRATVSLMITSPEALEAHLSSLFLDVALDGVILFDPSGLVSRRFEVLRSLLRSEGWRRQAMNDGFAWNQDRRVPLQSGQVA